MKKLIAFLLVIPLLSLAQIPDPMPNTYVNDWAKILTPDQIHSLNERIISIETKTSVQFAIILINDLPGNMDIADYTLAIGRKWHVGNARNGLIYCYAINNKKQRLEVAAQLQGDITDYASSEILEQIRPFLRSKDYAGGMNKLLDEINQRIDPVAKEQKKLGDEELQKKKDNGMQTFLNVLYWIVVSIFFGWIIWYFFFREAYLLKKKEEENKEIEEENSRWKQRQQLMHSSRPSYSGNSYPRSNNSLYNGNSNLNNSNDYSSGSSSGSSSSSSENSSGSSYGNWGSGSSDSGSSSSYDSGSSSGFDGGGSSGDV